MTTSTQLGLTHLIEGQSSAEVTFNEALNAIDAVIRLSVIDRDLATPPGSPTEGDRYLVAASGTGDWSGEDGNVAVYLSGWTFLTPQEGWMMWVVDEALELFYDGSSWLGQVQVDEAVTSYAGGGQANATQLNYGLNIVTVNATVGDSVKAPIAINGARLMVVNATVRSLDLFPQSGGQIGLGATDAAFAIAAYASTNLICGGTRWWAV